MIKNIKVFLFTSAVLGCLQANILAMEEYEEFSTPGVKNWNLVKQQPTDTRIDFFKPNNSMKKLNQTFSLQEKRTGIGVTKKTSRRFEYNPTTGNYNGWEEKETKVCMSTQTIVALAGGITTIIGGTTFAVYILIQHL